MEGWGEFYVGEVGAAAALAGLLFVAISINIEKILAVATLPAFGGGGRFGPGAMRSAFPC